MAYTLVPSVTISVYLNSNVMVSSVYADTLKLCHNGLQLLVVWFGTKFGNRNLLPVLFILARKYVSVKTCLLCCIASMPMQKCQLVIQIVCFVKVLSAALDTLLSNQCILGVNPYTWRK